MDQNIVKCPKCNQGNPGTNNYCLTCGTLMKPSLVNPEQKCPFCQFQVTLEDAFCPNCGKKIREKPMSSSLWKQIGIYLISFFLPPLGLWPAFKYLRQNDRKLKSIGIIAIILTFISLVITGIIVVQVMNEVNQQVNSQIQNLMQF